MFHVALIGMGITFGIVIICAMYGALILLSNLLSILLTIFKDNAKNRKVLMTVLSVAFCVLITLSVFWENYLLGIIAIACLVALLTVFLWRFKNSRRTIRIVSSVGMVLGIVLILPLIISVIGVVGLCAISTVLGN